MYESVTTFLIIINREPHSLFTHERCTHRLCSCVASSHIIPSSQPRIAHRKYHPSQPTPRYEHEDIPRRSNPPRHHSLGCRPRRRMPEWRLPPRYRWHVQPQDRHRGLRRAGLLRHRRHPHDVHHLRRGGPPREAWRQDYPVFVR